MANNDIKFSIITPTLVRTSLMRTCGSVDKQTYKGYEHIVMVDTAPTPMQADVLECLSGIRRNVIYLGKRHNDYGNLARNTAWEHATGDYIMYLDDDDYYMPNALETIAAKLKELPKLPDFAVFNCTRMGQQFFHWPPRIEYTCSCQYVHKRVINGNPVKWPTHDSTYQSDGRFLESLKTIAEPVRLDTPQLVVVDTQSMGR